MSSGRTEAIGDLRFVHITFLGSHKRLYMFFCGGGIERWAGNRPKVAAVDMVSVGLKVAVSQQHSRKTYAGGAFAVAEVV